MTDYLTKLQYHNLYYWQFNELFEDQKLSVQTCPLRHIMVKRLSPVSVLINIKC